MVVVDGNLFVNHCSLRALDSWSWKCQVIFECEIKFSKSNKCTKVVRVSYKNGIFEGYTSKYTLELSTFMLTTLRLLLPVYN